MPEKKATLEAIITLASTGSDEIKFDLSLELILLLLVLSSYKTPFAFSTELKTIKAMIENVPTCRCFELPKNI